MQLVTSKRNAILAFSGILVAAIVIFALLFSGGGGQQSQIAKIDSAQEGIAGGSSTNAATADGAGSSSSDEPGGTGSGAVLGTEGDAAGGQSGSQSGGTAANGATVNSEGSGSADSGSTADATGGTADFMIVEEIADPYIVARETNINFVVKVKGDAVRVRLRVAPSGNRNVEVGEGLMIKGATDENGITTWTFSSPAPRIPGGYVHTAYAESADGRVIKRELPEDINGPNYAFIVQ